MFKKVTFSLIFIFSLAIGKTQVCEIGAIFVSGPGCGCLGGCDLTSLGGPNCGAGVGGNCTSGTQTMSHSLNIPATCGVKIVAEMKPRVGCSASGADGNSTSSDRLRIRNTAGPTPPWQIGGSNASLYDQMIITGPATIVIEGAANRQDEIISYSIEYDSGPCNCSQILPISLTSFTGKRLINNTNLLEWSTSSEINNDYFTIERSENAFEFFPIKNVKGAGTSNSINSYQFNDEQASSKLNYYRLKQTDYNGDFEYSSIITIDNKSEEIAIFVSNDILHINTNESFSGGTIQILEITGKKTMELPLNNSININVSHLKTGIYIYNFVSKNNLLSEKFIIR